MQRGRLFLWVPVCLSLGIGYYFTLNYEPMMGLVQVLCSVTATLIGWALLNRNSAYGIVIWIFVLILLGFLLAVWRTYYVEEPVLGWRYYGPIEGHIVAIDRSNSNRPRVTLADPSLGKISQQRTPAYVRVSLHSDEGLDHILPGAWVQTVGSIAPPSGPVEPGGFDFQQYAWFKRLGAVGYSRKPLTLIKKPDLNSYALHLFNLRMKIADFVRNKIEGQTGAFAAAIITGDRSSIDPKMLDNLRASNLAHLLAISGLHMGLLFGFVFALVRYGLALIPYVALHFPTKKIGAILALIAGFAYLQISGAAVATERAYIMVSVMLVGVLLDRPAITLRAVALAATLLLIVRPESLMQAGFQMSFAATTALVACFEALKHQSHWQRLQFGRLRWAQPILALIISSFIAGAATAPFAAYHFNQFAQFGLLANFASVPVMGMIVMPSAVLAGLLSFVGFESIPFWFMGQGIDWILGVSNWVAGLKGGAIPVHQGAAYVLPIIGYGGVIFILWRGRLRFIGPILGICAIGIWMNSTRPEVLVSDTGRLLGVLTSEERALNRFKGSGFIAQVWLENDGDKEIQANAASRSSEFSDIMVMPVRGSKIGYAWPKKTDGKTIQSLCEESDVLITPNWDEALTGSCVHITKKYLRYQGSVAIRIENGTPQITTARQVTGARLWNTWWLR